MILRGDKYSQNALYQDHFVYDKSEMGLSWDEKQNPAEQNVETNLRRGRTHSLHYDQSINAA